MLFTVITPTDLEVESEEKKKRNKGIKIERQSGL